MFTSLIQNVYFSSAIKNKNKNEPNNRVDNLILFFISGSSSYRSKSYFCFLKNIYSYI